MAISKRIRKVVAGEPKVINTDMGIPGDPINRSHPFYFGFVATIGALAAFVLMRALASASNYEITAENFAAKVVELSRVKPVILLVWSPRSPC